ncbi:MAG: PrsW family intramembrane metalloprotease [Clostridia bacterium]|nr:PrsW family intramembrane metalloprotease [Clostridia bacterium]
MGINEILLICAALLPAAALCIYVFAKDRVEKEPLSLLLGLFVLGALTCYPAGDIEGYLIIGIQKIFEPFATSVDGNTVYLDYTVFRLFNASKYFVGVALVEELGKWLVLIIVTQRNKNFNSLFDGIIYAVFVSLGFAAFENVLYVLNNGWINAAMRAVTAVPGHAFDGVLMGYYYSLWHMHEVARDRERTLKAAGAISKTAKEFSVKRFAVCSLLVPVLAHGLYDYSCTINTWQATLLFYGFLLFLYIYCFCKICRFSKNDTLEENYSAALILRKYKHLPPDTVLYTPTEQPQTVNT